MNQPLKIVFTLFVSVLIACGSPSNKRGVSLEELEKIQNEEAQTALAAPAKDALTANELLEMADCNNLQCVQLFMKERSGDFVHAAKGEFAALHRSVVTDTAGAQLVIPLSTLYVDINPQADWRMVHTLHTAGLARKLLEDFHRLNFIFIDSGYYLGSKNKQGRYRSSQYPGKTLYVTSAFEPWQWKGLYKKTTWPCILFEVYGDKKAQVVQ